MYKRASILAVFAAVVLTGGGASAATIGFETAPPGSFVMPSVTESGFTYSEQSGSLFVDPNSGNPNSHMNGSTLDGGGVLRIVSAVLGQSFQFLRLDVAGLLINASGSVQITVTGVDNGATVATDTYTATLDPLGFVWVTNNAINLAGLALDELLIGLPGEWNGVAGTKFLQSTVDNIVLDALPGRAAVPEPGTLTFIGTSLLGLVWLRRQHG
jgi:hypothetical protein